jgi:hypothetical protein
MTKNGIKYINFDGRTGFFDKIKTFRLRKDQVDFLENKWDKETLGEFAPFLRHLIDGIQSKKVDIEKLYVEIGYKRIDLNND